MKEWLYPGAKVVCVDARARVGWAPDEAPVEGKVYEVDAVFLDFEGLVVLTCVGLHRSPEAEESLGGPVGYGIFRFRPLQKRKTDISVFTRLLTPSPREKADA